LEEWTLNEIRKGNDRVLRDLYKTHYPMILNLVMVNSGTEPEAKDIYQEAVIAFYERIKQKDFVLTCKIKTYLYAVSKHLWLKRLYIKKRSAVLVDDAETFPEVEAEISQVEEQEKQFELLQTALSKLGEPCNTLIRDFYIHDLSMEQIREKFGYTNTDNAKNQKYKCLQRLKKIFFSVF
jgi:RNA polymerase sigma factor (sigma-70 family)